MIKPLAALVTASAVSLCSSLIYAQVPITSREAVPVQSPSASTQLVLELQSLREEISSLLGTIEELEYKVQRLEKKQSENYEDLDSRVANLYSSDVPVSPPVNVTQNTAVQAANPVENASDANAGPADSSPNTDIKSNSLYDQGFAALRQGDRDTAIQAFSSLVTEHPKSKRAPDALYWLGETYWLANKKEESRQTFVKLLDMAPDYRKTNDAMYRLGVIYDQLGDFDTAFDYMSKVLLNGSSQSAAAQAWINEHQPEEKESATTSTAP